MDQDLPPHAVRTLRRQPPPEGIYASKYSFGLGALICTRLMRGESLRSICREDPRMPTEKTVWNWARTHPEFAAMRAQAITLARRNALAAQTQRDRERRAQPSRSGRRAWNRGRNGYCPEMADAICDRLCVGETLADICRDPAMPSVATVYNWLRAQPAFVTLYRRAREVAFDYVVDVASATAPWLGREAASMRALRQIHKAAFRRCAQLAPKRYANGVYGVEAES